MNKSHFRILNPLFIPQAGISVRFMIKESYLAQQNGANKTQRASERLFFRLIIKRDEFVIENSYRSSDIACSLLRLW